MYISSNRSFGKTNVKKDMFLIKLLLNFVLMHVCKDQVQFITSGDADG